MSTESNILIVDDNESIGKSLKLILDRKGYNCTIARTGKGALMNAASKRFDIGIVDITLPGMKGLELLTLLSEQQADISIIIITGHSTKESALEAIETGVEAYLEKPLNIEELLDTIARLVEIKRKEFEKKQADKELAATIREFEIYTSLLKHDLRNGLQVIMGYQEAAIALSKGSESDLTEVLEAGLAGAERMDNLISAMSRSSSEDTSDIVALIERVSDLAERTHKGLKVNIRCEIKNGDIRTPRCRLLPIIFENIFRNTAEFVKHSPTINILIEFSSESVVITMSDNGPGISEELVGKLFQKGASITGRGLGLFLSRRIIESIDGQIEHLPSVENKGAVFRITLPLDHS